MYLGFKTSPVTQKNQLTYPAKFKADTGDTLLITAWFETSLLILPFDTAEKALQKILLTTSNLLPETRDLERFFYGNAQKVTIDSKNRFVLPQLLGEYAEIRKTAVFVGVSERIELWDQEKYQNYGKIRELQIRETAINLYNRIFDKTRTQT